MLFVYGGVIFVVLLAAAYMMYSTMRRDPAALTRDSVRTVEMGALRRAAKRTRPTPDAVDSGAARR